MKLNQLTPAEKLIVENKGTEAPYSGKYNNSFAKGVYLCKRCNAKLFYSQDKFPSDCGWPSFDQEIPRALKYLPDADGERTEIQCNTCGAHLGHVFKGEGYTERNTRHCVNSISLHFISDEPN
ncbi:MAG: methionine-R-sulfoxide reductase [bacterium]